MTSFSTLTQSSESLDLTVVPPKLISNIIWLSFRVHSGSHKGPGMRVQNVAQHWRVTQKCKIRVSPFACPFPGVSISFRLETQLMHLILNNIPEWLHDWVLTALTSIHKRKKIYSTWMERGKFDENLISLERGPPAKFNLNSYIISFFYLKFFWKGFLRSSIRLTSKLVKLEWACFPT